jgi:mono/diheme cytochrome c family protein
VVAPNGDIYAKTRFGGIFALRDTDGDGRADTTKEFGPGDGGTHIALHDGWLYHSSRTAIYRYKYTAGELVPTSPLQTIVAKLPAERDHDAKAFAFDDQGRMLVEIGSPYNVYSNPDRQLGAKGMDATEFQKTYGGFWRFDVKRVNQTQADGVRFATGHRHALALIWHPVSKAAASDGSRGAQLYQQICAACHMQDGSGVSSMHPALVGSGVLAGEPSTVIRVILHGPAQVLPAGRPRYATVMPPFAAALTDDDIAEILTFTRRTFGKGASAITTAQVVAEREQRPR